VQVPVMPVWLNVAPVKLAVLVWHTPQSCPVAVGTWLVGLPCAPDVPWLAKLPLWQVLHRIAVTAAWLIV
jgi:hypothetical protein